MGEAGGRHKFETPDARLRRDLTRALDRVRNELERVELLSVALGAFAAPVPDYEPGFRHLRHATASAVELK